MSPQALPPNYPVAALNVPLGGRTICFGCGRFCHRSRLPRAWRIHRVGVSHGDTPPFYAQLAGRRPESV
jgi:hypothetical protein